MSNSKRKVLVFRYLILALILFASGGFVKNAKAQELIKHDLSAVTTTAEYYSWDYYLSSTKKKIIKYFIVKDDAGIIKSAFDACDVCYGSQKGYQQVGNQMQCMNCGNKYLISKLGTAGTGGCWPGYIPNEIEGDQLVITDSDLKAGAYYFPVLSHSSIDKTDLPAFSIIQNEQELILNMPSSAERSIRLVGLNGQTYHQIQSGSAQIKIDISKLPKGIYILNAQENELSSNKKIFIY